MSESRARQRIRKAVESRGFKVLSMDWEPWGQAMEMSGVQGGWMVITDHPLIPHTNYGDEVCGLSVEEVLADIDYQFAPTEPCGCYPENRQNTHPLIRLKGDPERPLHEPTCQWFIDYWMHWWTK